MSKGGAVNWDKRSWSRLCSLPAEFGPSHPVSMAAEKESKPPKVVLKREISTILRPKIRGSGVDLFLSVFVPFRCLCCPKVFSSIDVNLKGLRENHKRRRFEVSADHG